MLEEPKRIKKKETPNRKERYCRNPRKRRSLRLKCPKTRLG